MSSLSFYKCLLKCSLIIILLEYTAQTQAVENWDGEDHFNSGRKLMGSSMNGGEFAIYIIAVVILSMISICCRIYCRHACKDECSNDDSCENCGCDDEHSLSRPSHASAAPVTNTWQQPVLQQPRQISPYTNFGDLSSEPRQPGILSFYNRTNFATSQNTATVFAQDSSNIQTSPGITSAHQFYNSSNTPTAPQLYNVPSESHTYNIPSIPAAVNSVNADDAPPDYASVILGDLVRGNERTQYPSVIQEK